jgi:hypothetical protein
MSNGLGRLQSLTHALSRLLEARVYLESGDDPAAHALASEVQASAVKARTLRDAVFASLDESGHMTGLMPDERARVALGILPMPDRLRLAAELVEGCISGPEGEQLAQQIRGLGCSAQQQN